MYLYIKLSQYGIQRDSKDLKLLSHQFTSKTFKELFSSMIFQTNSPFKKYRNGSLKYMIIVIRAI